MRTDTKPLKELLACKFQIGDHVKVSSASEYYHDWRGWSGYVCGIQATPDGADLNLELSDQWPPKWITDGFFPRELEHVTDMSDEGKKS